MNNLTEKLQFTTKLAYGSGDFGPAITANILVFFLLYFFTNVAGLPAGIAGTILAVGKIVDAVNDPIVGIWSDRTRSSWGRRLPWMFWGALPFGLFFFLQWLVPNFSDNLTVNTRFLFVYYVLIGILFNISYTMVNLPYTALTPELTQDYDERTSLNSFRMGFSLGGSILSLLLSGLIFQLYPGSEQEQYAVLGLFCSLISIVAIYWCVFRVPERGSQPILSATRKKVVGRLLIVGGGLGIVYGLLKILLTGTMRIIPIMIALVGLQLILFGITLLFAKIEPHLTVNNNQSNIDSQPEPSSILRQIKTAFSNRPFLYVIGIYLASWLGVQLTASILIYFVVSWMGLPASSFPSVALAVQGTALVMLFIWKLISDRLGKKTVYFLGTSLWIVAQFGLFFLQPGQIFWLYFLAVIAGCGVSVAYLIPWSMLPDVIELDELLTGERREGIFYSFMVLIQKIGLALALFLVGIALDLAGFLENVPGEEIPVQPESALLAIRIAIGPLPTVFLIFGLIIAYFYPITSDYHAQIRQQLQEKKRGESQ